VGRFQPESGIVSPLRPVRSLLFQSELIRYNRRLKMDTTTGEIELLQGTVAGNKEAFGAVVRRYQSLVCAVKALHNPIIGHLNLFLRPAGHLHSGRVYLYL